jgi:hypothetical protein
MTSMTGAWYDAEAGRLYYTLAGDRNLYYRYFLTENKLVGAERFTAPRNGVDFREVTGGFVVDGSWYYRDVGGVFLAGRLGQQVTGGGAQDRAAHRVVLGARDVTAQQAVR